MNHTSWDNVAQEMFGITTLVVGQPYSEIPEVADPAIPNRYFGGMLRIPIIHRSRYNDTQHWDLHNVYNVPFNMHGMHEAPADANDSDSEPDYRQEQMDDYNAMVMDNVRDAESRAQW